MFKKSISFIVIIMIFVSSFLCSCSASKENNPLSVEEMDYTCLDEYINNPYMGYVHWASNTEKTNMDFSLVYVDIYWNEIEKTEGEYDFSDLEDRCNFKLWQKENKKAIFRIVLDCPNENSHMDIPNWLYDKTGDGIFYDVSYGKGYCPNYSNEMLIKAHKKLIQAISKRYKDDSFLAYIELGSIGHWGEWHISEDIDMDLDFDKCNEYVSHYIDCFDSTKLLMRRPFEIAKANNLGLYNDSFLYESETNRFIDWINNGGTYEDTNVPLIEMSDAWKTSPIGGEVSSSIDRIKALDDYKNTIDIFSDLHVTFIGPTNWLTKDLSSSEIEKEKAIANAMGYKLYVSNLRNEKYSDKNKVIIKLSNAGVAPIYYRYDIYIKYKTQNTEQTKKLENYDITKVLPNNHIEIEFECNEEILELSIALLDESMSEGIALANDTLKDGYFQKLI